MAQFKFIGDPRHDGHGPEPMTVFGHSFYRDEPTDIPDDDKALIERLSKHSHLQAVNEDRSEPAPKKRGRPPKVN